VLLETPLSSAQAYRHEFCPFQRRLECGRSPRGPCATHPRRPVRVGPCRPANSHTDVGLPAQQKMGCRLAPQAPAYRTEPVEESESPDSREKQLFSYNQKAFKMAAHGCKTATVLFARAQVHKPVQMNGCGIAPVTIKTIIWETLMHFIAICIPRSLGENGRSRDGRHLRVPSDDILGCAG